MESLLLDLFFFHLSAEPDFVSDPGTVVLLGVPRAVRDKQYVLLVFKYTIVKPP